MKNIKWKKYILSDNFESESCCFYSLNDKEIIIVAGEYLWKVSDVVEKDKFRNIEETWLPEWPYPDRYDKHSHLRKGGGEPQYKADTYDFLVQVCEEKRVITVGMHKDPIYMHKLVSDRWEKEIITKGGVYESVIYADLFGNGRNVLITVPQKPNIAWYEEIIDETGLWKCNLVGSKGGDWHGLGVGDIDGDNKNEIITRDGVYKFEGTENWTWKDIYVYNEDNSIKKGLGDIFKVVIERDYQGNSIIFSTCPHAYGFWYWTVKGIYSDRIILKRKTICNDVSQLHNISVIKVDGSIFVCTGKRKYAHGKNGDVDPEGESKLLFFQIDEKGDEKLDIVDKDSGAGICFDFKFYKDKFFIASSNKNGLFLFIGEEVC